MSASGPLAFCAIGIFILSSIPGNQYPKVEIRFIDKWMHFLMYLPLGLAAVRYFWWKRLPNPIWPLGFGALYGAIDEWHQLLIPQRSCSMSDFITDVVAVATAIIAWRVGLWMLPAYADMTVSPNRLDRADCAA